MARPVTLTQLETRVRQRANLDTASNAAVYPQSVLDDDINEGVAELYDLLVSVYGQDYFEAEAPFTTIANQSDYVLGTDIPCGDFYKVLGVDITYGENIVNTCKPFMRSERNRYKWYPGWVYSQPVFYRLFGNRLRFIPTPNGAYQCNLLYTPTPRKLINPGDFFDGINGWEEYVVLYAAMRALVKQEQFEHMQALATLQAQMRDRILGSAGNRDAENPERVSDTKNNDGWIGQPAY